MNLEHVVDESALDVIPRMQERVVRAKYFGLQTQRNPWDFWTYQEIICATKPDVIVEVGVCCGGMTLALAHLLDAVALSLGETAIRRNVVGIDIDLSKVPDMVRAHPRVCLIEGDGAKSEEIVASFARGARVMVIEDSSHTCDNTLAVLRAYAGLVTPGCYFIVEDSICWHPLPAGPYPGPMEAIEQFLSEDDRYVSDREIEPLLTWGPKGYLRRVK